jgi:hypothetical protein
MTAAISAMERKAAASGEIAHGSGAKAAASLNIRLIVERLLSSS